MNHRHWREIVEIVGVVSIVASLLLLAWEVHRANRIAAAEIELRLAAAYDDIHAARYENPEFAQLFPKIEAPGSHLITATDYSRMEALARHLANVYWSAQLAHDKGLLDENGIRHHRSNLAWTLERWPALQEHFVALYRERPAMQGASVFEPVGTAAAREPIE